MSARWITILALAGALAWGMPAIAQDHGHGHDKGHGNPHGDKGKDKGDKDEDGRWETRGGYQYRTYGPNEGTPPGWSKGKKTGWGNCGMPPGQAKKYGCRSYVYNGRTHYYYRDEQGRILVRRPVQNQEQDHEHGHH